MSAVKKFGLGVVIGKFLPPHHGHHHLIDRALERSAKVVVFVCEKPSDPVPGALRVGWLQERHPMAEVRLIDDRYDENDSRVWAENTMRWLGRAPDAVFTSEDYGDAYAGYMGCRHVLVDRAREIVPCSGTLVRENPWRQWEHLSPAVRAWYAKRVVVLGAESTGTTTLAMALADHFQTAWVPEYGREYSVAKMERGEEKWESGEFVEIAREQNRRENAAAREANRILVCDTNSFATILWHRRYEGCENPELVAVAAKAKADLYLLTGDEIPFVQDGLRDGEHIRQEMHGWFVEALEGQEVPWVLLRGTREGRLERAVQEAGKLWQMATG